MDMKKLFYLWLSVSLTLNLYAQEVKFHYSLTELYADIDRQLADKPDHAPVIGISSNDVNGKIQVNTTYVNAVLKAGGVPLVLPCTLQPEALATLLRQVDGLLLTGGEDFHPLLYGEEPLRQLGDVNTHRDVYDLMVLHIALQLKLPILGICRGEQLCNIGLGGTLYQDLPAQKAGVGMHRQSIPAAVGSHSITIEPDSYLHRILGREQAVVNSFHHQAVKELAPGLKVSARSADGVVEAIEGFPTYNLLALQFHPEHLVNGDDAESFMPIFRDLIERAKSYKRKP